MNLEDEQTNQTESLSLNVLSPPSETELMELLDLLDLQQMNSEQLQMDFIKTLQGIISTYEERCRELEIGLLNMSDSYEAYKASMKEELRKSKVNSQKKTLSIGFTVGGVTLGIGLLIGLLIH